MLVCREPIISSESIQFFNVQFDKPVKEGGMPWGVCALNPQMMKQFNAGVDGDFLKIIKPMISPKVNHTEVLLNLLWGGWSDPEYPSSISDVIPHHITPDEFKAQMYTDLNKQMYAVKNVGTLRKKVIASCQHLGFDVIDKLCRLYDVEAGLGKVSAQNEVSPRVWFTILQVVGKLIRGKESTFTVKKAPIGAI